jgi:hypothetical protein
MQAADCFSDASILRCNPARSGATFGPPPEFTRLATAALARWNTHDFANLWAKLGFDYQS